MAAREPSEPDPGARPPRPPDAAGDEPADAELGAVLDALTDRERFRQAEARVTRFAPELQHVLLQALKEGGWLEAHESQLRQAATAPSEDERLAAVRALLAEETRMGMMVGVAVGWELARELDPVTGRTGEGER